jgi:hypothetical protein
MPGRKKKKKDSTEGVSYSLNWTQGDMKGEDLTHQLNGQLNALNRTLSLAREIEALDYMDMLIDVMDEYPDAQYIISKVRRNLK